MLADLAAHVPADDRERAMTARVRALVARAPDAFERARATGHVTGSAWIVSRDARAAVLVHHRKLDRWLQPGGHADGDADLRAVSLREAREETGLRSLSSASPHVFDVDVHLIARRGDDAKHEHFDVRFAWYADRAETPSANAESHAVRWIALDELSAYGVDASVLRLAAKTPSLARYVGRPSEPIRAKPA